MYSNHRFVPRKKSRFGTSTNGVQNANFQWHLHLDGSCRAQRRSTQIASLIAGYLALTDREASQIMRGTIEWVRAGSLFPYSRKSISAIGQCSLTALLRRRPSTARPKLPEVKSRTRGMTWPHDACISISRLSRVLTQRNPRPTLFHKALPNRVKLRDGGARHLAVPLSVTHCWVRMLPRRSLSRSYPTAHGLEY